MTLARRMEFQPTVKQQKYFTQACGVARFTWNRPLAEWNRQYRAGLKPKARVLKRRLKAIKYHQFPWLEYKTVLYGSKLTVWDRFYAISRLCSACGWKYDPLSLSDRKWTGLNCGCVHHPDHNAAANLLQVPQAMREFTALKIAALASRKTGRETAVVERGTLPCAHIRAPER